MPRILKRFLSKDLLDIFEERDQASRELQQAVKSFRAEMKKYRKEARLDRQIESDINYIREHNKEVA